MKAISPAFKNLSLEQQDKLIKAISPLQEVFKPIGVAKFQPTLINYDTPPLERTAKQRKSKHKIEFSSMGIGKLTCRIEKDNYDVNISNVLKEVKEVYNADYTGLNVINSGDKTCLIEFTFTR